MGVADRVDRGQIDDIEAQRREARQRLLGVLEGAVTGGIGGGRTGEELVPGGEPRRAAIGADREHAFGPREPVGLAVRDHERVELGRKPRGDPRPLLRRRIREDCGVVGEAPVIGTPRVRLGLTHLLGAFQQLGGDVVPRVRLLLQLAPPGGEPVHPPLDRELPLADPIERNRGVPAIILEGVGHRDGSRPPLPGRQDQCAGGERVVTIREDVGTDPKLIAHEALDRVASRVHRRRDTTHDQVG